MRGRVGKSARAKTKALAILFTAALTTASGGYAMAFSITSPDFDEGSTIPVLHTCEGSDLSPELVWEEVPEGTRSFMLIVDDPDAPSGTFTHWVVFDIPAAQTRLARGMRSLDVASIEAIREGLNGFGRTGYGGPCPPRGHGPHRYIFRISALDVESIGLPRGARKAAVEAAASPHVLATATTTGTFERK